MTNIISFSLWGENPKYTIGAIRNAELAKEIYPGWKCRFYIGEDVPNNIIETLKSLESEIVQMGGTGWNGMFWRFLAADSYDIVISRDTDSRLNFREKAAVEEWLNSDKDFHIMRDHPYHATAILGGMWGSRNGILRGISQWINAYNKRDYDNKYQVDQNFLRELTYTIVKDRSFVHDEFFEKKPFPTPRNNNEYVGASFNEQDTLLISLTGEVYE
jgi:protein O-GlcNAc transferase